PWLGSTTRNFSSPSTFPWKRRIRQCTRRPVFSRRAAPALSIAPQHLDRPLARRLTSRSLARFVEDVGGLQLDSINVVDRAHHLTLWSRFGALNKQTPARLVYT